MKKPQWGKQRLDRQFTKKNTEPTREKVLQHTRTKGTERDPAVRTKPRKQTDTPTPLTRNTRLHTVTSSPKQGKPNWTAGKGTANRHVAKRGGEAVPSQGSARRGGGLRRSLPLLLKQREGDRRVAGWLGQPTNVRSCARWMLRLRYCGHLTRRPDSRGKTLMLGGIGGRRRGDDRGRDGWMASATSLSKLVVHGEAWGAAVHGVAKSRTRLSD